ncbi:MAG: hypothetical protein K2Y23_08915 [Cyanobacteria bacterium]|nr:hypothetical protein [Cyanobacteriota bacterium]
MPGVENYAEVRVRNRAVVASATLMMLDQHAALDADVWSDELLLLAATFLLDDFPRRRRVNRVLGETGKSSRAIRARD